MKCDFSLSIVIEDKKSQNVQVRNVQNVQFGHDSELKKDQLQMYTWKLLIALFTYILGIHELNVLLLQIYLNQFQN